MIPLSTVVALVGLLELVQPVMEMNLPNALLGVIALLCAITTYWSTEISSFLNIFVRVFSAETTVFGLAVVPGRAVARRLREILAAGSSASGDSDLFNRRLSGGAPRSGAARYAHRRPIF